VQEFVLRIAFVSELCQLVPGAVSFVWCLSGYQLINIHGVIFSDAISLKIESSLSLFTDQLTSTNT
jgi:hypothetical protein